MQITKITPENELRTYFQGILELKKQNNEFPVNFDEVWMLVFSNRSHALRSLRANFVEGVDYQSLTQNGQHYNKIEIKMTTGCLEYFIARKVRPVFEVYRQVFHKVAEQQTAIQPMTQIQALLQSVQAMAEIEQKQIEQEKQIQYHSQEIENLKQTVDNFVNESHAQLELFKELPLSTNEVPKVNLRTQIVNAVALYAESTKAQNSKPDYQFAWRFFYKQFQDRYHRRPIEDKSRNITKLDWLQREKLLQPFYDLVSHYINQIDQCPIHR